LRASPPTRWNHMQLVRDVVELTSPHNTDTNEVIQRADDKVSIDEIDDD